MHTHARNRPMSYKTQAAAVKRVIEGKEKEGDGKRIGHGVGKRGRERERENASEIVNGSASIRSRVFRNHCYVK